MTFVSACLEKLIPPAPLTCRAQSFSIQATPKYSSIYCHGRCVYLRPLPSSSTTSALSNAQVEEIRHTRDATVARLSPDGKKIAIGDVTGKVKIMCGDKVLFEEQVLAGKIADLAWNKDGDSFVVCGEGRGRYVAAYKIKDGADAKSLGDFVGPTKNCSSVAWNDSTIVVASDDFSTSVFDCKSLQLKKTLRDHTKFVTCVAFNADGSWLASGGADGKIFTCNITENEKEGSLTFVHSELTGSLSQPIKNSITGIVWIDNHTLCSSSADGILRLWNKDGSLKIEKSFGQQILGVASATFELLTIVLLDGTIKVLTTNTFEELESFTGHTRSINDFLLCKEEGEKGGSLLRVSADSAGRVVDWKDGSKILGQTPDQFGISTLIDTVNCIGATSPIEGQCYFYNHSDAKKSSSPIAIPKDQIDCFLLDDGGSNDNDRKIAIITKDSIYQSLLTDFTKATSNIIKVTEEGACITAACHDKDSIYYAESSTISKKSVIKRLFINNQTSQLELVKDFSLTDNVGKISCLAISNEKIIAAGDDQRRVQLYANNNEGNDGFQTLATKWCHHASTVTCLAWSIDGKLLVSGGLDNNIFIWSHLESKIKPIAEIRNAHSGVINKLKFSQFFNTNNNDHNENKKEYQLYSASTDGTIKQWIIKNKNES